jgi:hypothetical protein
MRARYLKAFLFLAALAAPSAACAEDAPPPAAAVRNAADNGYETLASELRTLEAALPDKKKELVRLRHRWVVGKGRMPNAEEVKKFEEKQAEGKATYKDNPYVNNNPLSTPGMKRQAYLRKVEEIRRDEERIEKLREEMKRLKR